MIWIITKKELQSFFNSLIAYVLLILFLGFSGFFTWIYGSDIFIRGQADLAVFFSIAFWTLFLFIPAITMSSLAEERKSGTIELLLTKAVSDRQLVIGKFLAAVLLVLIALLFTIPYYITITRIGEPDHGVMITGYLGLLLMSAAYISIGILMSSLTNNQIVAFLLTLFVGLFFYFVFGIFGSFLGGSLGAFFDYMSFTTHYESITRGVVDTKNVIYFLSIITMGIVLAEYQISKR